MAAAAMVLLLNCAQQDVPAAGNTAASFVGLNTQLTPNMPGWGQLEGAHFADLPEWMTERTHTAYVSDDYRIAGGSVMKYQCGMPGFGAAPCDLLVYYYECSTCESEKGEMAAALESLGFTRTRCGPKFRARPDGALHPMTGWVRSLAPGEGLAVPIRTTLEYALFAMSLHDNANRRSGLVHVCPNQHHSIVCADDALMGMCKWNGATCEVDTCAGDEGCTVCVRDEIPYELLPPLVEPQQETFEAALSFFTSRMPGWGELTGVTLYDFPTRYLRTAWSSVMPQKVLVGAEHDLKFQCPSGPLATPCDVAIFFYDCAPCISKKGGMDASLEATGYEQTFCAPKFSLGKMHPAVGHNMTAYVKQIQPGQEEVVELAEGVEFVVAGLSYGNSISCSSQVTEEHCTHPFHQGWCDWSDAGGCQLAKCHRPVGPANCPLETCVHRELEL